jgi:bacterial leucyl aminopeptidase
MLGAALVGLRAGALPLDEFSVTGQKFLSGPVPAGFSIDLDEQRLVQFAEDESPVWMTEREKVRVESC